MASKRTATSDLNHTNWSQEDDPEEAGSFSKASEDVIKNRVIKVAKRRNPIGSLAANEGEKKPGAFASFGGFTKTPTPSTTTSSAFSFLSNISNKTTEEQPKTNGLSNTSSIIKTSSAGMSNSLFQTPASKPLASSTTSQSRNSKDYYAKLKGLNESVAKWVNQHVNANPFINLTPVFRDYEKYINELDSTKEADNEKSSTQVALNTKEIKSFTTTTSKTETQKEMCTFKFKPSEENEENRTSIFKNTKITTVVEVDEEPDKQSTPKFNFGTSTPNTSSFAFPKASLHSTPGFSFGGDSSKPFTFSNVAKPVGTEEKKEENDEEEEPPKVEFTPVVEEGHVYTARCKLFVKKDGKFTDRGVGNLYLKPVSENDKVQLIMRADTSLGNLLCNLILSTNIPMQRMGNKDVMLVCIPTPDSKPPPVPILFRVKSSEEADELLKALEKHRK